MPPKQAMFKLKNTEEVIEFLTAVLQQSKL